MEPAPRVLLAAAEPFSLGALHVFPAHRQVERNGARETLEPRVMQVLVALAGSRGGIVGRDQLIERCWDNRIVGDNAINRVISRLRRLSEGLGQDCFELETVTKVGYRLRELGAVEKPAANLEPSRRNMLLGTGVAALAAVGGLVAWRSHSAPASSGTALAENLYRRGWEELRGGTREHILQARAYFRRATEADPHNARTWGGLALSCRSLLGFAGDSDLPNIARWSRSAAARARAIDPDDPDANVAIALLPSTYGNWHESERSCRTLIERFPDHLVAYAVLGRLLGDVGRIADSVPVFQDLLRRDPLIPLNQEALVFALWNAGRLDEADEASVAALRTFPGHPALWTTRVNFLMLTGRTADTLNLIADEEMRPAGRLPLPPELAATVAQGLARPAPRAAAVKAVLDARSTSDVSTTMAAPLLTALGEAAPVWPMLDRYLPSPAILGPLSRRSTSLLFSAATAPLRADSRFASVTNRIGLDDYWRRSGTMPDYRRQDTAR